MVEQQVSLDSCYARSEDVVARDIGGEFILVPLTSGIGDLEEFLYALNETGAAIWNRLDGTEKLCEIVASLMLEYEAPPGEIEKDVLGIADELLKRKLIIEVKR